MLDIRQTNDPIYYDNNQVQISVNNQLGDIDVRHNELRNLETDIVQLHEIHRDFAAIVQDHGGMIDNIETNVAQTETQVFQSVKKLTETVSLQSAARRKKIMLCTCGIITLLIIAIIITAVVLSKKSK